MIGYWTRFARTGDPSGHGAVGWPRFRLDLEHIQSLAPDGIGRADFRREHRYSFWWSLDQRG